MPHGHGEGGGGAGAFGALAAELLPAVPFAAALAAYGVGVLLQRRRGRRWPFSRSALWILGVVTAASGFVGPLADAAHGGHAGGGARAGGDYTAHMAVHLLVGMVAPLLLVRAAPVTLALRSLDVVPARRLARLLGSPPVRVLTTPAVAALIDIGGLWLLYTTPLLEATQRNPVLHLLVLMHLLGAGLLFTVAIVPADPSPHRAGIAQRAAVLVLALAAHGVLAKALYADPPAGIGPADAHVGAQLMFYGGDVVDIVLVVLLCREWYRQVGRDRPRPARPIRTRASRRASSRRASRRRASGSVSPPPGAAVR